MIKNSACDQKIDDLVMQRRSFLTFLEDVCELPF